MNKYPDFWTVLVGKGGAGNLLGYIVIAYICATAFIFIEASTRNVASQTPVKWSWRFLGADNLARIVADVLLIPITVRLVYQYIPPTWMLFLSCGIGFGVDGLALVAKNFGMLTTNKLAQAVASKLSGTDLKVMDPNAPK